MQQKFLTLLAFVLPTVLAGPVAYRPAPGGCDNPTIGYPQNVPTHIDTYYQALRYMDKRTDDYDSKDYEPHKPDYPPQKPNYAPQKPDYPPHKPGYPPHQPNSPSHNPGHTDEDGGDKMGLIGGAFDTLGSLGASGEGSYEGKDGYDHNKADSKPPHKPDYPPHEPEYPTHKPEYPPQNGGHGDKDGEYKELGLVHDVWGTVKELVPTGEGSNGDKGKDDYGHEDKYDDEHKGKYDDKDDYHQEKEGKDSKKGAVGEVLGGVKKTWDLKDSTKL
ncbi:hypothetical protein AAF712_016140 [Marasmius tenuissimus]|uniref:Uncharacterized protein n=1 Tax=Marasmius tenuissimus TaxID=585030 RepID=A0ABR2Z7I6_9AGAR